MTDLRSVLELAAEDLETRDLTRDVLLAARRTRMRRRGAVAAVAAASVVAGVILVPRVAGPSADPVKEPTSTPTSDPAQVDTDPATQPVWDPAGIPDLSVRATVVPEQLPVPAVPLMSPQERPMTGVVLATADRWGLELLDPDGSWRRLTWSREVPAYGPDDVARPAISSDGRRVATATEDGILVIDVTTGDERTIAWPAKLAPPRDSAPGVDWLSDEGFVAFDTAETWLVNEAGSREAPFQSYAFAVDAEEPRVYVNDFERAPSALVTWEGDQVVDESPFVQCERMVARFGLVACTAGSLQSGRSGPVVVDAATGEIVAYAPIEDPNAKFSDNGGLTVLGFIDEDTVVMVVGGPAYTAGASLTRHLVAWQFRTGTMERISSGEALLRSVAVAPALLE